MQTIKTTLTRKFSPKAKGLVLLVGATWIAFVLVTLALTPSIAQGKSLITLLLIAAIAGAMFHKVYELFTSK